jgi:hypothetical protein
MKEPVYEYDFGKRFVPLQEKYPKQQVFNWYLEDYQDKKDVNEFLLKSYLKELSPFDDYPKELEYPLIESLRTFRNIPNWYKFELHDIKMRKNKWSLVPYKYSAKATQLQSKPLSLPYGLESVFKKKLVDYNTKMDVKAQAKQQQPKKSLNK